jgi:hypothetical protein
MLLELDELYRAATDAVAVCIKGADAAVSHGWTPQREWYYWRHPRS